MQRILFLIGCYWLALLLPGATAFVPSSVKGASSPAPRPRTVASDSTTTALNAVAKKKKKAAAKKAKKGAAAKKKAASVKKQVTAVKKPELVAQMAEMCDLTKRDTEAALNAFLEVVQQNVAEGKKVTLVGFGSFVLKERAARRGRNPATGEEMDIPACKAPGFTAGKSWKARVNE